VKASLFILLVSSACHETAHANPVEHVASADVVQPSWRDEVHAVWLNGPSNSAQLGGNWPNFSDQAPLLYASEHVCDPARTAYTGYKTSGAYCQASSNGLNANPHLVMYSGLVGFVLDASAQDGNFFPRLGSTSSGALTETMDATDAFESLTSSEVTATLNVQCTSIPQTTLTAKTAIGASVAEFGLVRKGHAVTQVTIDKLDWRTDTGDLFVIDPVCNEGLEETTSDCSSDFGTPAANNPCDTTDFPNCEGGMCYSGQVQDPSNSNCNQDYGAGNSNPCPLEYPNCVGFEQGVSWGRCFSSTTNSEVCDADYGATQGPCTSQDYPLCNLATNKCYRDESTCFLKSPWYDVAIWGDLVTINLHWDGASSPGCSGTVKLDVSVGTDLTIQKTADFSTESKVAVLLAAQESSSLLADKSNGDSNTDVNVFSSTVGATVLERSDFGDFIVEVPTSTGTCSYSNCGDSLYTTDISVANTDPSLSRTVRLSLSRNFVTGQTISQSRPRAEITGLNVMVWDRASQQPNGIPIHISKNWHYGGDSIYQGSWWTANLFFRLPPGSSIDLTFAIVYEQYRQIPACSIVYRWVFKQVFVGRGRPRHGRGKFLHGSIGFAHSCPNYRRSTKIVRWQMEGKCGGR